MVEAKKDTSLNKRRQIDRSGRVMFGWVAGASVLVGFALVIGGFLVQRIVFETKVLAEKNQTTSTLDSNIKTYDGLRDNIRVLNTNSALGSAKLNDKEDPLRVILDALPADDNSLALGASVQNLSLSLFKQFLRTKIPLTVTKITARQATTMPIILEVFNR